MNLSSSVLIYLCRLVIFGVVAFGILRFLEYCGLSTLESGMLTITIAVADGAYDISKTIDSRSESFHRRMNDKELRYPDPEPPDWT